MEYLGEKRGSYEEARRDLETKKMEFYSNSKYYMGNTGVKEHPFFGYFQAFIMYFKKN